MKTKRVHVNDRIRANDLELSKYFVKSFFQEPQYLFLLSYEISTIDDNEFSVLHEEFMSKTRDFSCKERDRFSLEEMNDAEYSARYNLKRP